MRDYQTATWEGGSPACTHQRPQPTVHDRETSTLAGSITNVNHALEGYHGTCGRCGAVRHDAGIGNETVPDCNGAFTGSPCGGCWVCRLVAVFREVRRVLRADGTLWLNVGDSYSGNANSGGPGGTTDGKPYRIAGLPPKKWLSEKNLCMLPARLALALQADGWYLRSEIVWAKKNPMPESVTDRPVKAHEMVYLLTKSPRYFYDAEAVREAQTATTWERSHYPRSGNGSNKGQPTGAHRTDGGMIFANGLNALPYRPNLAGRNLRSVWPLASEPFSGAHFATFPSALVRRCLLASCSAGGVCAACGAPSRRLVERYRTHNGVRRDDLGAWRNTDKGSPIGAQGDGHWRYATVTETLGFAPACSCAAGVTSAVCLDPFAGAGTTMLTARDLFIRSIGVELNPTYCHLAASRLTQGVLALGPGVSEAARGGMGVVAHLPQATAQEERAPAPPGVR